MTGPDELRKAIDRESYNWQVKKAVYAAADAWKKDIEARDNAWALRTALAGDLQRARARIEALEKAIELQHQRFHCHQWESEIDYSVAMSGLDSLAALAGKE